MIRNTAKIKKKFFKWILVKCYQFKTIKKKFILNIYKPLFMLTLHGIMPYLQFIYHEQVGTTIIQLSKDLY